MKRYDSDGFAHLEGFWVKHADAQANIAAAEKRGAQRERERWRSRIQAAYDLRDDTAPEHMRWAIEALLNDLKEADDEAASE